MESELRLNDKTIDHPQKQNIWHKRVFDQHDIKLIFHLEKCLCSYDHVFGRILINLKKNNFN